MAVRYPAEVCCADSRNEIEETMRAVHVFAAGAALVGLLGVRAPAAAQERQEQEQMGPWKEMNGFHMALGPLWHPVDEKGDLAPLRENIARLVIAADVWAASTPPAACASVKAETVKDIAKDVRMLAELVAASAPDDKLRSGIAGIHEKFEPIEQSCVNK
jgi:hypothetical protein